MEKSKAKYRKNDVILLEDKVKAAVIDSKEFISGKGWLYSLKVVGSENGWKRYYESRLDAECQKVKNDKAIKVLFGAKKS
jgi:hypothetical protein